MMLETKSSMLLRLADKFLSYLVDRHDCVCKSYGCIYVDECKHNRWVSYDVTVICSLIRTHLYYMLLWMSSVPLSALTFSLRRQVNFQISFYFDLYKCIRNCSDMMQSILLWQMPRKMMLQVYNLLHAMSRNDRDFDYYHR